MDDISESRQKKATKKTQDSKKEYEFKVMLLNNPADDYKCGESITNKVPSGSVKSSSSSIQ